MLNPADRLPPLSITPVARPAEQVRPPVRPSSGKDFRSILDQKLEDTRPVRFSGHAQTRLLSRQIQLTDQQMARLQHGIQRAAQKGAQDSLVMVDQLAFIVSVNNRTVVTAVNGQAETGNVFTQIDSAVIV